MIFDNDPSSWQELQNMTYQMFTELGCISKINHRIVLVRGAKKIDVYVEDRGITPQAIYLCECKFWNKLVPQEIAHSFRTVVSDSGANMGFIISKRGFQPGAYEAAEKTNIKILNFIELQALFLKGG